MKVKNMYTGCLKIREFRIQSVAEKDPVELEKYLGKKNRSSWKRYKKNYKNLIFFAPK
jgi:hypothetical protein